MMPQTQPQTQPAAVAHGPWDWFGLVCGGLFLLLLAARLRLVAHMASAVPFWDEWDADLISIFLPPANGLPSPGALLAAHNEHRIVLTRLLDLALFWIEGRHWDILAGLVFNQAFFSMFSIVLLWRLGQGLVALPRLGLLAMGTVVMVNPFGWQAIAWSFESQIYFCIALSVLSFWLICAWPPNCGRFWLGVLAACLSPVSFGAGLATLMAASLLVIVRYAGGVHRKSAVAAAGLMAVVFLLVAAVQPHSNDLDLRHSVRQLAAVMMRVLSWPERYDRGLPYIPSAILVGLGCLKRRWRTHLFWFAASFDSWQLTLAAQIAIGRFDDPVTPRYTEILVVGIIVNLACLLHLCQQAARSSTGGRPWRLSLGVACAVLWIAAMAAAFHSLKPVLETDLRLKRGQSEEQAFNVAGFLKTNDKRFVLPPAQIPYHTPKLLAERLQLGAKAGIFPPIFLQGDTPRRDKWRKQLRRVSYFLAFAGLAGLAAGLAGLGGRLKPATHA